MSKRKPTKRILSRKLKHQTTSILILSAKVIQKTIKKTIKYNKQLFRTFRSRQKPQPVRRPHPIDLPISPPPSIAQNIRPFKTPKHIRQPHQPYSFSFQSILEKITSLRWFFILVFLYLATGMIMVIFQEGTGPFKETIIYSIMGFSTFFMGYLGWIIAQDIMKIINGKKTPS